jgi:hypothetical protein
MHSASIFALCGRLQKKVLSLNVAFTFVLPGIQWRAKRKLMRQWDVFIAGAGIAGLAAAEHLGKPA